MIVGLGRGGAEKTLVKVCQRDPNNSHRVVSLTSQGYYGPLLRQSGVPVRALRYSTGRLLSLLLGLRKTVQEFQPDVIHGWMPHGMLFAFIASLFSTGERPAQIWGIRAVDYGQGKKSWSLRLLVLCLVPISRIARPNLVAVGTAAKESHAKLAIGRKPIQVIENGYSLDPAAPGMNEPLVRFRIKSSRRVKPFTIGCVARFHPQKDHFNLIESLTILAARGYDFLAVLVGEGVTEENEALSLKIARSGLEGRVLLVGPTERPEDVYPLFDLHVLPSAFGEGFPNAVAESMAAGVPNVVTDVGDAGILVRGIGWVVPARDSGRLADAIEGAIVGGPHLLGEKGQKSREKIVAEFSESSMLEKYFSLYLSSVEKTFSPE